MVACWPFLIDFLVLACGCALVTCASQARGPGTSSLIRDTSRSTISEEEQRPGGAWPGL